MSDAVMVPRERLIEIIGGEVCVMADHGDSIDPSSVEDAADAILKAFAASTPVGGWEDISTAPKDGTMIITWCVHANAEHCEDAVADGYAGPVLAKWIDHNGGGFAWHGLAGQHTHWMPLPPPPSVSTGSRPQEAVPTVQAEPAVVDDGGWIVAPDGGWKTNPVPGLAVYIREDDWESVTSSTNWDWRDVTAYRIAPQPADGCSSNEGADGWIEHDGGPNPVPGQRVDVRWRDGEVSTDEPSRDWCWKPTDGDDTIIAYRILPQTEKGS